MYMYVHCILTVNEQYSPYLFIRSLYGQSSQFISSILQININVEPTKNTE